MKGRRSLLASAFFPSPVHNFVFPHGACYAALLSLLGLASAESNKRWGIETGAWAPWMKKLSTTPRITNSLQYFVEQDTASLTPHPAEIMSLVNGFVWGAIKTIISLGKIFSWVLQAHLVCVPRWKSCLRKICLIIFAWFGDWSIPGQFNFSEHLTGLFCLWFRGKDLISIFVQCHKCTAHGRFNNSLVLHCTAF